MKVTILCYNLSNNCVGRGMVLAEIVKRNHDVELVGPIFGDGIWDPMADRDYIRGVEMSSRTYGFPHKAPELLSMIDGDVIYAAKPKFASYGVALLKKLADDYPIVLDIDDWERGLTIGSQSPARAYLEGIPRLGTVNSLYFTRLCEEFSSVADAITVSNTFLREKFGGQLLYHARDTDKFDPDKYDKFACRRELGLPTDKNIVLFSGTPRPHKGIQDLAQAMQRLDRNDTIGVVVGASDDDIERFPALREMEVYGRQPFDDIPKWVASADIVAIPQRRTRRTVGQMPAKLFDAMAMGKCIVSTDVCDIPTVLDGTGFTVDSNSPGQLADAFSVLLNDREKIDAAGEEARQRCEEKYSYSRYGDELDMLMKQSA
ncbi:glycosyltransferase family 4 protein [Haloarchaeobius iranensis]|uniref:Glycosyltransferase involved in cell wall bisynthesis n=1 Tax=Haloarchaeobius iranensis TaxID=996166 RepID=A0A1H0BVJ6_9EURY|nr:glycosyltransferase family 4 protein [Haloarchaeobius iranensis]SDN49615.1 Glycosyltransferase involved in cell wall bisynthesis [Haloarchaeobius iranensis]